MPSSGKHSDIIWDPFSLLFPYSYPIPHAMLSDWAYSEVKTVELNLKPSFCLPTRYCSSFTELINRRKSGT